MDGANICEKFDDVLQSIAKKAVKLGYSPDFDDAYQQSFVYFLSSPVNCAAYSTNEIRAYLRKRIIGGFIDDFRRKMKRLKRKPNSVSLEEYEERFGIEAFNWSRYQANKREKETKMDRRERLEQALKMYSKRDRLIVTLHYYEGLTFKEVGEIVGVSESRCSQICARIRDELSGGFYAVARN